MHRPRSFNEVPLWVDPRPLFRIPRPRWSSAQITGMGAQRDGRHEKRIILGTEETLHSEHYRAAVIQQIGAACGYTASSAWYYQRLFFDGFLACFFSAVSSLPSWITILPQRTTVAFRQEAFFDFSQMPATPQPVAPGRKLWDHSLNVGGVELRCEGLVMTPKPGRAIRETQLVTQTIHRDLLNRLTDNVFCIREDWCYLRTPGDSEDEDSARSAKVPGLNQFFDYDRRVQTAPIIAVFKLSNCGRWVQGMSFNLDPNDGRVLDFRTHNHLMEYLLISSSDQCVLLKRAVTPGSWVEF